MEQVTFADVEYEGKKRRTRRELFLERMEALIPWERLEARIRPLYPKAGRGRQQTGRIPIGSPRNRRIRPPLRITRRLPQAEHRTPLMGCSIVKWTAPPTYSVRAWT